MHKQPWNGFTVSLPDVLFWLNQLMFSNDVERIGCLLTAGSAHFLQKK